MSQLDLYLFGSPRIEVDGQAVHIARRKATALLAYLVVTGVRHSRDALATLLWPENGQSSARAELRRGLYFINKALGNHWLQTDLETVGLNPELGTSSGAELWLDVAEFQQQLKACENHKHSATETCPDCILRLETAVDLYMDHFIAGFSLPDCPAYDEWQFFQAEELRRLLAGALVRLSSHYSSLGEFEIAITHARHWVALDSLNESAHQQLMRLYEQSGQHSAALRQYETCRQILSSELGVEPSEETQSLFQRIRVSKLISSPGSKPSSNLPLELTSFIGRKGEIAQVRELLQANRLVTLTGSGGVGKTRLSIRVAEEVLDDFPDGVWYIELAPLADPALVAQTVALTIGLREIRERSFQEALVTFLHTRQALIVLDNCEHLLAACASLTDGLLQGCPQLKLLATSREALRVAGEAALEVPSLKLPEAGELPLEILKSSEAVSLFATRAQSALPDFQVTAQNAQHVARICRRLDGIPLALELAAPRLKMLTTEQLASRLEDALTLLTSGSRTALPRQQTLRATIDWSYQQLDKKERLLLQRLAVFAGSFSMEGVEAVCAGDGLDGWEIFDLLAALVDKSIVNTNRTQGAETRYRLLETVRQYTWEKLFDVGENELLRNRHLEYYAAFAEEAYPHLHGAGRLEWTQRMKREYDNIREAIEWAFQDGTRALLGLSIATNLADRYLNNMGYHPEGAAWLKAGLQAAGDTIPKLLQARVYCCQLCLWTELDQHQEKEILEQCIRLCQEVGPEADRDLSLALSVSFYPTFDYKVLTKKVEKAVQIARRMGPPGRWTLSVALWSKSLFLLSHPQHAFDEEAYVAALECVQLTETESRWEPFGYWPLGIIETRRGQLHQARQTLQKAVDLCIAVDDKGQLYVSLYWLAWYYRQAGQTELALRCCQELYTMLEWLSFFSIGFIYKLGMVLAMHQRNTAFKEGDQIYQDGLRLIALWKKNMRPENYYSIDQKDYEQTLEQLREQLGAAAFQDVWAEGQTMTLDEGVVYAGSLLERYTSKKKQS